MTCPVPFCSIDNGEGETICRAHWRLVGSLTKKALQLIRHESQARARLFALRKQVWQRAKKQAIERASGI